MKKTCHLIITLTACRLIGFPLSFAKEMTLAQVRLVKGDVRQVRKEGFRYIKEQDLLRSGDKLETRLGGLVQIRFNDNSIVTLGPESTVIIKKTEKRKTNLVQLIKGQIKSYIKKDVTGGGYKFFVVTKNAGLGVRGTTFQIAYSQRNKQTHLYVEEGKVNFNNLGLGKKDLQKIIDRLNMGRVVTKGRYSNVLKGRPATNPVVLDNFKVIQEKKDINDIMKRSSMENSVDRMLRRGEELGEKMRENSKRWQKIRYDGRH